MIEKKFTINGMKCAGCVSAVEASLNKMNGVEKASANLADKSAIIVYDENVVSPETLRNEVKSAGFEMLINE